MISSLLQDALFYPSQMVYQKKAHRFALVANRFCWEAEDKKGIKERQGQLHARVRSGLRFEGVLNARFKDIPLDDGNTLLSLLNIDAGKDDKDFTITLIFSGGGAIQLTTEMIEVYLEDVTGHWATRHKPEHPVAD